MIPRINLRDSVIMMNSILGIKNMNYIIAGVSEMNIRVPEDNIRSKEYGNTWVI